MRHLTLPEFSHWSDDKTMLQEQGGRGDEKLDNSWLFENGNGFALEHDDCCMVFVAKDGIGWYQTYDIHFLFPPATRGKVARDAANAMIDHVFVHEVLGRLTGKADAHRKDVRWFLRQLGFTPFSAHADHVYYQLTSETWRAMCGLPATGTIDCTPLDILDRTTAYLKTII